MKDIVRALKQTIKKGEYKQCSRKLSDGEGAFCFLGLMCEVYRQQTGDGEWAVDESKTRIGFRVDDCDYTSFGCLPVRVAGWFGVKFRTQSNIAMVNDDCANTSFKMIWEKFLERKTKGKK